MRMNLVFIFVFLCFHGGFVSYSNAGYVLDADKVLGRRFDGIGAISGGGATSKLLINYPDKERSQILDFLFKPNFGASLQILKVEIGGDAQSTEGTESSHQHEEWEENYTRGYEWFMMKEAKKRNPGIKLYGLPWGFPGWLGNNGYWPYRQPSITARYIVNWINGAKVHHGLDIDYIGLWNEKTYDVPYVLALRKELDDRGYTAVQIVGADMVQTDAWDIVQDLKNPLFNKSVSVLGGHYLGCQTSEDAQKSGKPLWSSEDYSYKDNDLGAGCFARIINQNYVYGWVTSTIAWNLIASYYDDLPISQHGLMTANEPWSGHYTVAPPIWATAHTTQFTSPGWMYLAHRRGVGNLELGGTYVSLLSPDRKHLTIVMETLDTREHDYCLRPPQVASSTQDQNVTFYLQGSLAKIPELKVFASHLSSSPPVYMVQQETIKVKYGKFSLYLPKNSIYTLTTVDGGYKGSVGGIAASKPFPSPYKEDFDGYPLNSEAYNFAQQVGVFEIRPAPQKTLSQSSNSQQNLGRKSLKYLKKRSGNKLDGVKLKENSVVYMDRSEETASLKTVEGELRTGSQRNIAGSQVLQQVMIHSPIHWCPIPMNQPIMVIGNYNWSSVSVRASVHIPSINGTKGVFVASRVVGGGGCYALLARGVFFWLLHSEQQVVISTDLARGFRVFIAPFSIKKDTWYTLELQTKGNHTTAMVNGKVVFSKDIAMATTNGFIAMGTDNFGLANFDNFEVWD